LLKKGEKKKGTNLDDTKETAEKLIEVLHTFGVNVRLLGVSKGPTVTQYELQPDVGVKVSKIMSLIDDLKLNLAATDIRIEAPIPGKAAIGVEIPNKSNSSVVFRDLIESNEYTSAKSNLTFAVGKDIAGKTIVADIAKMPHVLIAGSTGSGKSVCINTLIMSILYKASPDDVKLIMVDPKVVELSVYNGIPHLLIPVVTDPKKANVALKWAVSEMDRRYKELAEYNVRDIKSYNEKVEELKAQGLEAPDKMPQILVIIDELADLMMVCANEVEESICRIAQLARAAGIHLVVATQRPSADIITGLIKANMPSRIAFAVSSGIDSRVILDVVGAERLLGKGDMLFYPQGYTKPLRVQGAFVSDDEINNVVEFLKEQFYGFTEHGQTVAEIINSQAEAEAAMNDNSDTLANDPLFLDAGKIIIQSDKASIGMLQRKFKIGFNRAARIMDQLCEAGVVGEEEGTKPRKILMSMDQFNEKFINEVRE
ncbi:MAG: DNA translocase FtsK, partial [Lachnospiraceae bacterium]|nr:DNA translocase FtsK [Lachnospiraceae bacterium]